MQFYTMYQIVGQTSSFSEILKNPEKLMDRVKSFQTVTYLLAVHIYGGRNHQDAVKMFQFQWHHRYTFC